jgi:Fe-S oxidoreductase
MGLGNDLTASSLAEAISERFGGENLKACLTCGECISRCFLTDGYPEMNPRKFIRKLLMGRSQELADSEFIWACTLCGRCTTECPKGISMDVIVRSVRGLAHVQGKGPKRLEEGLEKITEVGNNLGMDSEEFVDTIQWLAEEAAEEIEGVDEEDIQVPFDKEGAEYLYVPNPREFTSTPHMSGVYLKFFLASGVDWTMSSKVYDISNWAYYMGDEELNMLVVKNMVAEARRLGVRYLLSTECGHGFKIMRKDAERMIGEPLGFEVISIVQLAHKLFSNGLLKLKKGSIDAVVTYHDPCNVGRKLGIYDPPRELLKHVSREFVELWPNRQYSICCGGGGSVAQNTDMGIKRLETAKSKRDQILRSQADILCTSCQNCLAQLNDLQARYEMPQQIKSIIELIVDAIDN